MTEGRGAQERATKHVVVVGGGIAGLAAAWFLRQHGGDRIRITVLEAASAVGGKLGLAEVGELCVDSGAEALLARRPEAVDLVRAVGLGADLVHPATSSAGVWTRGRVRGLPAGQVMGIPSDLRALARSGVVSPRGVARAAADRLLPARPHAGDVSVGDYVRARLGAEVVERLVDPLLGGVYAGRAGDLSLDATIPQLAAAARDCGRLTDAARRVRAGADPTTPVFAGIRGGVGRLPAALAAASRAQVRTGVTVRALQRTPAGWRLVTGSAAAPVEVLADAVILAVPGPAAARLLAVAAPAAAGELAGIEYASVAIVTLVLPPATTPLPAGSGFLVPAVDGRLVKAVTFSSSKWAWTGEAAGGATVLRASVGRFGETADLARPDEEIVAGVRADLAGAVGLRGEPHGALVTRWGGALPQYAVGHLDRVRRIHAALADQPALAACGAAYEGVGIAACVASAARAAARISARILDPPEAPAE